jgi:cell shape-determining protein MreD
VRILIVIYLLVVGVMALLAQMILPVIFPFLNVVGFGSALVPLVVIYASLELGDERAPILAGILGLFLDLIPSSQHLGTSVLILFSLSALIVTQASRPESHT